MSITVIPGATGSTYTLVTADLDQQISCKVTATNSAGSANATSGLVGPIAPAAVAGFSRVPLGPGGFISGLTMHADGTKMCRMDTSGAYKWNSTTSRWDMMVTTFSIPAGDTAPGYGTNPGTYEIIIAPSNSARAYMMWAHAGDGRVWITSDRGVTFTKTTRATDTFDANDSWRGAFPKLAVDPINPDVAICGGPIGVSITANAGTTWTTISTANIPAATSGHYLFAFDPASATVSGKKQGIYCFSYGNGLYKSTNGGTSWALAAAGGPTTAYNLKVKPDDGKVFVSENTNFTLRVLTGTTWSNMVTGTAALGHGSLLAGIDFDPANPAHIVAVSEKGGISESLNHGASWTDYGTHTVNFAPISWLTSLYGGPSGSYPNGSFDLYPGASITFDPSASNVIHIGHGLGTCKGTPPGAFGNMPWQDNSVGLEQLCAKRLLKPAGNSDVLLAVMDQGIFNCDAVHYPTYKGIMPYFCAAWDADSCPGDPLTIISIVNESAAFGGPEDQSGISRDGGDTWTPWYGASNNATYHMPYGVGRIGGQIACGATRDNFMIIAIKAKPHYTTNGGASWAPCSFPADFPQVVDSDQGWSTNSYDQRHTICGDRVTANKFYARNGWSNKFYVSTNGGATFTALPDPSVSVSTGAHSRLQAVPGNAGHLTYTMGSSGTTNGYGPTLRSTDGGNTWIDLIGVGIKEVLCFGFGKNAPGQTYPAVYFIGWKSGVYGIYRSDDQFATWTMIGDYPMGCFDTPVDITGDPDVYGNCYISSGASGIFKYVPGS